VPRSRQSWWCAGGAQAPLQPLQDNLESQTYETFEKDGTKYAQYQAAIHAALLARAPPPGAAGAARPAGAIGAPRRIKLPSTPRARARAWLPPPFAVMLGSGQIGRRRFVVWPPCLSAVASETDPAAPRPKTCRAAEGVHASRRRALPHRGHAPSAAHTWPAAKQSWGAGTLCSGARAGGADGDEAATVLMVVGAGRGPLVRASLAAADAAGRRLRVYAVEKNANAVVTLQNLVASEGCACAARVG